MFIFSTGMRENEAKRVSFRDLLKLESNQLALQNYNLCFISFVWVTVQLVVPQFGKTPSTIAYAILRKNLMTICVSKCITIMFVQCTVFRMAKYFEALFWALLPAFTVCLLFRMSFKFIYILLGFV